jgi:hypothetical protein
MVFPLDQDEDGYPPVASERLWVQKIAENRFRLDNIPFYARNVSCEDVVSGRLDPGGELVFDQILEPSSNSTFRVIVHKLSDLDRVKSEIDSFGVSSEINRAQQLISVNAPIEIRVEPLLNFLMSLNERNIADFEEGELRHPLNNSIQ